MAPPVQNKPLDLIVYGKRLTIKPIISVRKIKIIWDKKLAEIKRNMLPAINE